MTITDRQRQIDAWADEILESMDPRSDYPEFKALENAQSQLGYVESRHQARTYLVDRDADGTLHVADKYGLKETGRRSDANHHGQMHATRNIDVAMVLVFVALMAAALAGIANGILT